MHKYSMCNKRDKEQSKPFKTEEDSSQWDNYLLLFQQRLHHTSTSWLYAEYLQQVLEWSAALLGSQPAWTLISADQLELYHILNDADPEVLSGWKYVTLQPK